MSKLHDAFRLHIEPLRAPRTTATYLAIARAFEVHLSTISPGRADVESFLARPRPCGRRASAATRNQELAALRVLARFASQHGFWAADPTQDIPFLREPPRDPAVLSMPELQHFFGAAGEERNAVRRSRALAMLALLSQAGLRVGELVALDVGHVDLATSTLIAVCGKGSTVHDVPLNAPASVLLGAWLAVRTRVPGAHRTHALFLSRSGGRLGVRAVQRLIAKLRAHVGTAKAVTPHTMRHTTATLTLMAGADISTVSGLLRHDSIQSTVRYLHLLDRRRRDAVDRIASSVPADVVAAADVIAGVDGRRSEDARACTPRSSQNAAERSDEMDAQPHLDDIKNAA